jgi:outer membrane usher protein
MLRYLLVLWILIASAAYAAGPDAENMLILEARVNGVPQGDVIAIIDNDDTTVVWIASDDYDGLGIELTGLPVETLDGTAYVRVNSSDTLAFTIDWNTLEIAFTASPDVLGTRQYSFSSRTHHALSAAPAYSGYLNYAASWLDSADSGGVLDGEVNLNLSLADWVLHSDHLYNSSAVNGRHQRQNTYLFRDWADRKLRLTLGDTFGSAGQTGRGGAIAGFRLEKLYALESGSISSPLAGLAGTVTTPSVAEIYIDNTLIRTVDLAPGRFEFRDIWYYGGMRQIDVKITDAAGSTRTLSTPYYFSESSLGKGLHEYSYAAGARRQYGEDTDSYGGIQLTGIHRYGLTDAITLGVHAEYADDYISAGTAALLRTGRYGIIGLNLAASHTPGHSSGQSVRVSHAWSGERISVASNYAWQSPDFAPPTDSNTVSLFRTTPAHQFNTGISSAIGVDQSVSLELAWTRFNDNATARYAGLRYNRNLARSVNLGIALAHRSEESASGLEGSLTVSIAFGDKWNSSSRVERGRKGERDMSVTLDRSIPSGTGTGVRMDFDRGERSTSGELNLQHNTRTGTQSFSGRRTAADNGDDRTALRLGTAGALALSDRRLYVARTIGSSFAVVKTGGLADVGVFHNNQFIGKTGKNGTLLVPNTGDYMVNQIRIDDRDVPMDFTLSQVSQTVVPATGKGVPVEFEITRMAAVAGQLVGNNEAGVSSVVKLASLTLSGDGGEYTTTTGPDGDFYLEGVTPGKYRITATSIYHNCGVTIAFTDKDLPFADLGELRCEK